MSYDLQAEGLNGVNTTTAIVAGGGWSFSAGAVIQVSGTALDTATPFDVFE